MKVSISYNDTITNVMFSVVPRVGEVIVLKMKDGTERVNKSLLVGGVIHTMKIGEGHDHQTVTLVCGDYK
jgi:hypothetical protein